jgi:membrane protein DedA with SNARE-associated domain
MDLPALIAQYGYATVLVGTMFEGETVLLLAGYSAHRGYLDLAAVTGIAWLGGSLGDQLFFWIGRRHGQRLIARRPALRARVEEAFALIERHPVAIILAMRFLWGLRMAMPIAIGISRVGWRRFVWLNLLSAALWAPLVAGIGWTFGALLAGHAAMLHHYEHWVMAGMAAAALLLRAVVRRSRHKSEPTR